jgi:hypothetical protein
MHFGGRKFSDWIRKVLAAEAIANKILSQVFHSRYTAELIAFCGAFLGPKTMAGRLFKNQD